MKKTIDRLFLAQNIIEKRFSTEDENYGLYVCGCFCLLNKFGDEFLPILEDVFNKCNFIIEEGNIVNLAKQYNIDQLSFDDIEEAEINCIEGLSFNGIHFYFDNDGKVHKEFVNPTTIIPTNDKNSNELLNTFIHELSHLIKGHLNNNYYNEFNYYNIRSGLSLYEVNYYNGYLIDNTLFSALDEIINTFQTTDMIKDLKLLKNIPTNSSIKKFLDTIDYDDLDYLSGYEGLTEVFTDLWENDEFKNIIENDIVIGDLDNIINNFNNIMGRNCFHEFSELCDDLENVDEEDKYDMISNDIYKLIDEFNKKTSYQYKK